MTGDVLNIFGLENIFPPYANDNQHSLCPLGSSERSPKCPWIPRKEVEWQICNQNETVIQRSAPSYSFHCDMDLLMPG